MDKEVKSHLLTKSKYLMIIVLIFIGGIVTTTAPSMVLAKGTGQTWIQQLNQLVQTEAELQGAIAGISIRSASDGRILYQHQGNTRLTPASNMKLLTAAAALKVLGEDYTFSTEVYSDGRMRKKGLAGNLYLKGKGDPTLLKADFDKMAVEIKKRGIKKITGDIIGDDSWYDDIRYSLDLPWSDETTYYGAQISALTASPTTDYDAGSIKVVIRPAEHEGDRPAVKLTPKTTYVKIINRALTVDQQGKKKIEMVREHGKNTIMINGTIPVNSKKITETVGVWEPQKYTLSLFKQSLGEHGIKVLGTIKTGAVPESAKLLYTHQSMPLSKLLVPFMKLSNNTHAEILIKEMGKVVAGEGSWEKGLSVLKSELTKWGVNPDTMVLRDGSGISHVTGISANQISQLLFAVQKEEWFPVYLYSLPVAGSAEKLTGGSLRNRMQTQGIQGKVQAKTGTLSTVSSLSGYLTAKSGQKLIFSIILNHLLDEENGKMIEDQMVSIIANP